MIRKGLNYLIMSLLLIFAINLSTSTVQAAEDNNDNFTIQASSSTFVRRTASYSKNNYCEFRSCLDKDKKPMPQKIWVTASGGYAGYITIENFYISKTHIVVTYAGNIPKAPYAPTLINEDEER